MREYPLKQKLNPANTALIVTDVQRDFCAQDGALARRGRDVSGVDAIVDRIELAIQAAKKSSVFTAYTQQIYDRQKLNPLQLEQYDLDGKLITCDVSTNGYHFYRINPDPQFVYPKYNYNIFSNPQLQADLQTHGIKTLVISGSDTAYCVETAIRNGFDLGYKIVVPQDLLIGNTKHPERNRNTLDIVEKTYGVVTNLQDIIEIWNEYKNN